MTAKTNRVSVIYVPADTAAIRTNDHVIALVAKQHRARNLGSGYLFSTRERDNEFQVPKARVAAFKRDIQRLGFQVFTLD